MINDSRWIECHLFLGEPASPSLLCQSLFMSAKVSFLVQEFSLEDEYICICYVYILVYTSVGHHRQIDGIPFFFSCISSYALVRNHLLPCKNWNLISPQ